MNKDWPTKDNDMHIAQRIMEEYATLQEVDSLGLFELIVDKKEKKMDFRLSSWVVSLADHFKSLYGEAQGEFVTRRVISHCITKGETLH